MLTQLRCIKQAVVPAFYLAPGCFYGKTDGGGGGVGGSGRLHFRNTRSVFKFNVTKTSIKEIKAHSLQWKQVQDDTVTNVSIVTEVKSLFKYGN